MNIKRAIISVYNKDGLEEFARFLYENNVEIISTGGTANFLEEKGIKVTKMSEYTEFPEILNGRVKSLHPKLFGGVLAVDGNKNQEEEINEYNIPKVDMVVVNFYPFNEVARNTTNEKELLDNIDIGGFALLRAAAKNYRDVIPVVDPEDYRTIIDSIEDCGDFPLHNRRKLALKAFYSCSKYDSNIHKVFSELFASEKYEHEFFEILGMLRYGSNPLQEGTLLKFVNGESLFDNVVNLTTHKSPTLRILKDVKLLYSVAVKEKGNLLAFSKKGVFVFAYSNPSNEDIERFYSMLDQLRGGVVYTEDIEMIKKLKNSKLDGIITSSELNIDHFLGYKPMVFKINKKEINMNYEYFVDGDLVVKQECKKIKVELPDVETIGFEVARLHRSDTIVYIKNNKIYSGVQNALNRKVALKVLEEIVEEAGDVIENGTLIFDSPVNSEFVIEKILDWKIEKIVVPPALPKDEKYLETISNHEVNVVVTGRRYHRYWFFW